MTSRRDRRRHRPGAIETISVDSLDEGDFVRGHHDGAHFGDNPDEAPDAENIKIWAKVDEVLRPGSLGSYGVMIRFTRQDGSQGEVVYTPDALVRRRMEQP